MIALHAGFRERNLILWGESSSPHQTQPAHPRTHPFDAGVDVLDEILNEADVLTASEDKDTREAWLPTARKRPVPSSRLISEAASPKAVKLDRWFVRSIALKPRSSLEFLCFCSNREPLFPGVIPGADLAFWIAALRFAGALVLRQQFLPSLVEQSGRFFARWKAAFSGREDERKHALAAAMPSAARAFSPDITVDMLLTEFLDAMVDELVRGGRTTRGIVGSALHDHWVEALHSRNAMVQGAAGDLRELAEQLRQWQRPIAALNRAPFRLTFRLEEPDPEQGDLWRIRYLLQGRKDPSLIVPANVVWSAKGEKLPWNEAGSQPREHLLLSLGQASGICPRIEESLKAPAPDGYLLNATGAHDFLTVKAMALEEAGFGVMLPSWWTRKGTRARLSAGASVKSPFSKEGGGLSLDSLVDFQWKVSIGSEQLTFEELKELAALKAPLVKFRGQWVQVSADEIQTALDFWTKKGHTQMTAREVLRMALSSGSDTGPLGFAGVSAEGWIGELLEQLVGHTAFEETPVPAALHGTLRPYQVRGYSWLAFVRRWGLGACLADDMGLGKTIQTLSLLQKDRSDGADKPVLLVCPMSVMGNWQKEAERFTPELSVMVHHGMGRTRGDSFAQNAAQNAIVVSSYSLLHRDYEHLKNVEWAGIVLDEAQNIKNPATKQAAAARALKAGFRIALTGTPVENNVGDLWSLMEFLNPGLLGTRAEFKRSYFVPIQSGRDPGASERLKKMTGPFILRRLKTDKSIISDLPEKLENKVYCTLTKEQASLYSAVVNESLEAIESAEGMKRKGVVLATLTRLKQVCNHPAQFLGDNSALPGRSGKLARLTEMLEEAISVGDRALIFSQFAEMGGLLHRHLRDTFAREVLFLHGAVSKKQRDLMVGRFQNEPNGPPLFILSLKAGGTGLNLTAANHVFHFDRWWNPAVENQATDRAFRIGQKKNVQVHKFICAGTLEEKIEEMIANKERIAQRVVGAGEGWLTELSTSQLRDLFALGSSAVAE